MPVPRSASPVATSVGELTRMHCSHCDSPQLMIINGVYPALYCGKDIVHFQCMKCGTEGTQKVADRHTLPRAADAAPPRPRDVERPADS